MDIRRITQVEAVVSAGHLFDTAPLPEATERFLADDRHHLLIAYVNGAPARMITGVEMTHPDKGTEMFLYELGVEEAFRRRGVGWALVAALTDLARDRGCYGMWVVTGEDNPAAVATYQRAGGTRRRSRWCSSGRSTRRRAGRTVNAAEAGAARGLAGRGWAAAGGWLRAVRCA